jgi:thiamine monophosphate synthase
MLLVDLARVWRFEENLYLNLPGGRSPNPSPAGDVDMRLPFGAVAGGVNALQLREPDDKAVVRAVAAYERIKLQQGTMPLTFLKLQSPSSSAGLAHLLDCGAHIPESSPEEATLEHQLDGIRRGSWGEHIPISCSVHSAEVAIEAERAGADLLVMGTVFPSASHPDGATIGVEGLREVCERVSVPVIGIGGITAENAGDVIRAGASGVAVISAIWDAEDPRVAAASLRAAIGVAWRETHPEAIAGTP